MKVITFHDYHRTFRQARSQGWDRFLLYKHNDMVAYLFIRLPRRFLRMTFLRRWPHGMVLREAWIIDGKGRKLLPLELEACKLWKEEVKGNG